jgi:hypothetical protein
LSLFAVFGASVAESQETHWQRVMAGERKVGFVEHTRRIDQDHIFTSERLTLELGKAGRRVTYQVSIDTESTRDGWLMRMVRESRTGEGHSRVEVTVLQDETLVQIGAGRHQQTRLLRETALKSDEFARRWLQNVGRGELFQNPLRYRAFDPVKAAVVDVELTRLPGTDGPPRIRRVVRVNGEESATTQTLDPDGEVLEESLRLGGLLLTLLGASEAEAKSRNEALDHVVGQFQKSPYRIPANGMRAKIRYGFDNGGRAPRIPVGGGQRSWTEGQTTWIQVCAECAPEPGTLADDERAHLLAATPWLNHGDAVLMNRARRVAGGSRDPAAIMRRLTEFTRGHMSVQQIDMLGYGSALEALQSRRGDCTEYAVLLAALGRAQGVPTRVVSGLVYARHFEGQRHVFVPHVWVHAWTGTSWRSFDAALGQFDSTHLAFAVSDDGNPAELFAGLNLAHELRLTSAARVLPRKQAVAN